MAKKYTQKPAVNNIYPQPLFCIYIPQCYFVNKGLYSLNKLSRCNAFFLLFKIGRDKHLCSEGCSQQVYRQKDKQSLT